MLLYFTSTLFHALPQSRGKRVFQVLDHAAIYFLIAGTYTPFTLGVLRGAWGWTLFGIVWAMAVAGTLLKAIGGVRVQHAVDARVSSHGLAGPYRRRSGVDARADGGSSGWSRAASPTRWARGSSWPNESGIFISCGTCSWSRARHVTSSRCCGTRREIDPRRQAGGAERIGRPRVASECSHCEGLTYRSILSTMKIATGKVVGGKVVIDGASLEGASVTILARDEEKGFRLTPEEEAELLLSIAEAPIAARLFPLKKCSRGLHAVAAEWAVRIRVTRRADRQIEQAAAWWEEIDLSLREPCTTNSRKPSRC